MVLGGREEGEGHLGGSRSPGTCAETRMHAAESGEEACAMAGGDGRGLNGAEQAEDTRRGPRHGVRTMCWTCTQRAAGPLEVSAAVEKALWECGPRWEGVGRRQGGPGGPTNSPASPPPSFSPSWLLPSWPPDTRHVCSSLQTLAGVLPPPGSRLLFSLTRAEAPAFQDPSSTKPLPP